MTITYPVNSLIRYLQIPPAQVTALKSAMETIAVFDLREGTQYGDCIIELLERLEFLYTPPSSQPQGTPGLLSLHQHGVKAFADGDFRIEYKEEKGMSKKEAAILSAKSEICQILADFGYLVQTQGVLQRS
jgi:hypothetical protein